MRSFSQQNHSIERLIRAREVDSFALLAAAKQAGGCLGLFRFKRNAANSSSGIIFNFFLTTGLSAPVSQDETPLFLNHFLKLFVAADPVRIFLPKFPRLLEKVGLDVI
jgi:hypothetical protein